MNDPLDLVWDVEANGLLEESTSIHCQVFNPIGPEEKGVLWGPDLKLNPIQQINRLYPGRKVRLIGHNIIGYDIPLIKKFYDIDLIKELGPDAIVDTYLWSLVANPDREMPKGCPTFIINPVTKKRKNIGPHSLEAWGWRVGERKVEIHDWREFNEGILDRCVVDTDINKKVFFMLCEEMGIEY